MSRAPAPRLASGQRVSASAQRQHGGLAAPAAAVRTAPLSGPRGPALARTIAGLALLSMIALLLIYAALAATVLVALRLDGSTVLVQRAAFPIGQAPVGTSLYAAAQPVDHSLAGRITEAIAGVPGGQVVQVLAPPDSKVSTSPDGLLVVNGNATEHRLTVPTGTLNGEYLVRCVSGCPQGSVRRVRQHWVVGRAAGRLTPTGLQPLDAPSRPGAAQ